MLLEVEMWLVRVGLFSSPTPLQIEFFIAKPFCIPLDLSVAILEIFLIVSTRLGGEPLLVILS